VAKSSRKFSELLGNKIDQAVRNGRSQQTKGISIGPDTSLVITEILLSTIDQEIDFEINNKWFRYVDDYEFCFANYGEAESALGSLQTILGEYELQLNPSKTKIIDLPIPLEAKWATGLRQFSFRRGTKAQSTDLLDYFDYSIELWRHYPDQAVIHYAIARTLSIDIDSSNWNIFEMLLLQWSVAKPDILPHTINILKSYGQAGYKINKGCIAESFGTIINDHVRFGHSSEISWTLWGCLLLNIELDTDVQNKVTNFQDPIVALLFLNLHHNTLQAISKISVPALNWGHEPT